MQAQPNREWLDRMADAEDAAGCISVGGLAADLGQPIPHPIWDAICCDKCSGFYLPSGRCDHCNQYRADTADNQGEQEERIAMSQSVITRHDIEHFTFREYRKLGTTKLSNETLEEGQRVLTLEGEYTCGELSRLAIDAKGNVYPVAESVFAVSYEPAGADPAAEIARLRRLVHDIYSPLYDARTMIELALIGELHMTPDRVKQLQEISAQCEALLDRLIGEKHGT